VQDIRTYDQATVHVLAANPHALQYGSPSQALRRHIVALMAPRGVFCQEEQVFLTIGAQQAISLLARLLPGFQGTALLEEIIYSGVLQAIEPLQPKLLLC
jgi:2-aminoadipate transaminase